MAFTKAELEALKNALLASNQPITAATHRSFVQNIIDELYDAQSRGDLLAGVQEDAATEAGDLVLLIRGGEAFLVPASVFGGGAGTLAGLGDVIITDPQDEEILSYNSSSGKWVNIPLTGLFVTQAELTAALDALQLPEGARLIFAELTLTSDTAGSITAQWVDFTSETESVTDQALTFNGGGLPAAGNFRFDIIQGANDGTVSVKQGVEANAASVVVPTADANNVVLSIILWAEDGTAEVNQPNNGNAQQNDWSLIRFTTLLAPDTAGKFAKVWEGSLSRDNNYSIELSYAEPKNALNFLGSGLQTLRVSWTCDGSRAIIADTVQITTGAGSTAGEFILYRISGNRAALYHKSNHFWGRIQFRVVFQNSQVRLQDFVSGGAYGAAPTALQTFTSVVEAGGGASAFTDLTDVPNSYLGQQNKFLTVNAAEDGLEFTELPAATGGDEPAIRSTASADQTLPSGVLTILDYDSEVFNNAAPIYSLGTNGRITVNSAGVYDINAGVVIEADAVTALQSASLGIFRNGDLIAVASVDTTIAAGASSGLVCATQITLASGDIIDCRALVNSVGGTAPGLARRLGTLLGANATQVNSLSIVKCTANGSETVVPPVAETYASLAALIADQANQIANYIYADEKAYYEYLGTTTGTIADYRRISPAETPSVAARYVNQAAMIAAQGDQLSGWLYFDGSAYWEYLGTTAGTIADYRNVGGYLDFLASSGTILFDAPRKYGFSGSPVTGNLTVGTAGASEAFMAKVLHNHTAEPTVSGPGGVTIVKDGGTYEASVDNIIYFVCHKNDAGSVVKIAYTITNNQL